MLDRTPKPRPCSGPSRWLVSQPWLDPIEFLIGHIAWQLGGEAAFNEFRTYDENLTSPGSEDIRKNWNPMRLEQRISRIDRIGQERPFIRIVRFFYRNTVEYDAYTAMEERIQEFQENVGTLQPILAANLESLIRESVMDGGTSGDVRQAVRNLAPSIGFDLDDLVAAAADQQDPAPLLHMNDLTCVLNHPEWLPDGYAVERRGGRHWRVTTPDGTSHTVTTNRAAHDYAAGTVEFFGPGSPAFPDTTNNLVSGTDGSTSSSLSIGAILNATASD